jgi:hypothetical protein
MPSGVHETLERGVREKKVSMAGVMWDAAEQFLAYKRPLFARQEGE